MRLIDRAWKANVNVWKRHLTLQSVFNRGECMMHVDKIVDGHVLDQSVDRISREIACVPFNGRIRSKRSSCMQPFFFFKGVQDMLTNGLMDLKFRTCFPEVHGFEIWTCFPEVRWIEVWTCFLEVWWIGILDVLPRGPKIEFGHASQRSDGLESWTCFPEVQGFEFWTCFPEVWWIWKALFMPMFASLLPLYL